MAIDTKELQTRIALKYDSYDKWTTAPGKNLVLLKGEVGICEIPAVNAASEVAPTVLFKVGDGTKTFEQLPWASAKAADVYRWAKASEIKLVGKTLTLVGGDVDAQGNVKNLEIPINYATPEELEAVRSALDSRVAALESKVTGEAGTVKQIEAIDKRLDVIEGADTVEGSIAKALKDAKEYAEAQSTGAADGAEEAANNYTDQEVEKDRKRISDLEAYKTAHESEYTALESRMDTAEQNITGVETRVNEKLGTGFSATNTVAAAIEAAANAADAVDDRIDALVADNGQIGINKKKSEENAASILAMDTAYKKADSDLSDRIGDVEETLEVFFADAAKDGEGLANALDTLKEIQTFINTDGTTAAKMAADIKTNTDDIADHDTAIKALQAVVNLDEGTEGGLKTTLSNMQSEIDRNEQDIVDLKALTGSTGTIQTAIKAAKDQADDGVNRANQAQADATDAQNRVKAIEDLGLSAVIEKVDDNAADIKSLQELTSDYSTVKSTVNDLNGIVVNGANSNAKLRQDIGSIQSIINDGTKGNEALSTSLQAIVAKVNDSKTGLAAAHTAIEDHEGRIAAIESDYLKAADQIIFQCGTSSTNTFTV